MSAIIMNGTALATEIKKKIACEVKLLDKKPGLAVILVGNNPAARVYANGKKRDCIQCGVYSEEYTLSDDVTQNELLKLIGQLNDREDIDGILIEKPLPKHLDEQEILRFVRPDKDVDCFHPYNVGLLMLEEEGLVPCTPAGVMEMLLEYKVDLSGKHCVIVGRSSIVGKPLAMLLVARNATVTLCHTYTKDLAKECRRADVLIAAAGQAGLIKSDMVKEGCIAIDVSMNQDTNGNLCGDLCYGDVAEKASLITPVPGGIGPMTRAMLMKNTLQAAKGHSK